jgi:hypothetical protein
MLFKVRRDVLKSYLLVGAALKLYIVIGVRIHEHRQ